jgi:nicotinamidase-related amidase
VLFECFGDYRSLAMVWPFACTLLDGNALAARESQYRNITTISEMPERHARSATFIFIQRDRPGREQEESDMSTTNFTNHFSADDAALVLIDFQPQMFMGVESHDRNAIKNNLQIIAKSAKLFNVPTVLSTVTAETFSGPFVPEVTEGIFPSHEIVDRTSINAWLTPNFVKAIEATGRKRLIIAGLWTGACAAFNVLEGLRRGYEVFFVADACGDTSIQAHERAVDRMIQAGAVPTTAQHFVYELQQDWSRQKTYQGVMDILKAHTAFGTQIFFSKWALAEHEVA